MAVRFPPGPAEHGTPAREDRADLAEVIELRSRLPQPSWGGRGGGSAAPVLDADAATRAESAADERAGVMDEDGLAPVAAVAIVDAAAADAETDYDELVEQCNADGVRMLARQARSSGELRDALLRLAHDRPVVEDVIDEFERSLYLDDVGLARAVTEKLREAKRASRGQIRAKLRERQIRDDVIEAVLGELDDDQEYELLREAAAERVRKLDGLDRQTAERRLLGFLARRGWSGESVMRAAREALDAANISGGVGGSRGDGRSRSGSGLGGARHGSRALGSGVRFQ